ncbi:DUF3413 domain-containing protein, partial [Vibrio diabolicus]|nr:DUF3413 domain-containing protein [Vibrio diabolicus]
VLLMIDVAVYQQYRFHLSGFIWELLIEGGDEVISLSWYTLLMATLQVLAVAIACTVIALLSTRLAKRHLRWAAYAGGVWLAALLVSQSIHMWRDANYDTTVPSYSVHWPLYYPLTAKRFFHRFGWVDTQAVREQSLNMSRPSNSHL